ncbi:MAG: cytochrome c biogenesis protein CcsA [Pseudomonadota bacterium]
MTISALSLVAMASYLACAFVLTRRSHHSKLGATSVVLATLALLSHGLALFVLSKAEQGFNLGIFPIASLVALCVATLLSAILIWQPVKSLGVVIYPLAAVFVAIAQWLPSQRVIQSAPFITQVHIALSIFSYSLLAIAAVQAIYLAFAHHRLKTHRPVLNFLPPLSTMENILFQLTGIAFALLTISLVLGGLAIEDIGAQHLAHKIFFSILAWFVFAVLLIGRIKYHWRGHRAVKYVCTGVALLAIGFFGSKVVLELILHRA